MSEFNKYEAAIPWYELKEWLESQSRHAIRIMTATNGLESDKAKGKYELLQELLNLPTTLAILNEGVDKNADNEEIIQ